MTREDEVYRRVRAALHLFVDRPINRVTQDQIANVVAALRLEYAREGYSIHYAYDPDERNLDVHIEAVVHSTTLQVRIPMKAYQSTENYPHIWIIDEEGAVPRASTVDELFRVDDLTCVEDPKDGAAACYSALFAHYLVEKTEATRFASFEDAVTHVKETQRALWDGLPLLHVTLVPTEIPEIPWSKIRGIALRVAGNPTSGLYSYGEVVAGLEALEAEVENFLRNERQKLVDTPDPDA